MRDLRRQTRSLGRRRCHAAATAARWRGFDDWCRQTRQLPRFACVRQSSRCGSISSPPSVRSPPARLHQLATEWDRWRSRRSGVHKSTFYENKQISEAENLLFRLAFDCSVNLHVCPHPGPACALEVTTSRCFIKQLLIIIIIIIIFSPTI